MKERFCCGSKNKKVSPSISAPLHLILQAPSPASHEWRRVPGVKRVCQICHFALDGQQGVKCKNCGLRAHSQCGSVQLTHNPAISSSSSSTHPVNNSKFTNIINTSTTNNNNLLTTVSTTGRQIPCPAFGGSHSEKGSSHFEPRIKKLLQVSIPVPPTNSVSSDHSHSTRLSSCGDSVAASTAIVVGTTTISTETPRSESKSPEITITPGSEVAEEHQTRGSSSEPIPLPDSGFSGGGGDLLDGRETDELSSSQHSHFNQHHLLHPHQHHHHQHLRVPQSKSAQEISQRNIRYVDGPLDGALYALVRPVKATEAPSSADSGISITVDQMKDLDRLLNALVQDAESIPDIPYHAREDSLPFSYGMPDKAVLKHRQEQQERLTNLQQQREQQHQQNRQYTSPTVKQASSDNPFPYTSSSYTPQSISARQSSPPPPSPKFVQPSLYSNYGSRSNSRQQRETSDSVDRRYLEPTQAIPDSFPTPSTRYVNSQLLQKETSPRTHHIQLELEDQIIPYERKSRNEILQSGGGGSYSRSLSQQPYRSPLQSDTYSSSSLRDGDTTTYRFYSSTPQDKPSTSFSFNNFGRAIENVEKRVRSQSAEGRRFERDENADEWLARQKQKLEEKRAHGRRAIQSTWMSEFKKSLPSESQLESQSYSIKPSSYSNVTRFTSAPRPVRSNMSTPGLYSSDDEEYDREVEREMFNRDYSSRGRKVQRYHSETAYDRVQRAPSQQSYSSMSMMGETPGFPTCPPTPYLNRPISPAYKPPRSPKPQRKFAPSTPTIQQYSSSPIVTTNEWSTPMNEPMPRAHTPVNPRPVFMGESEVKFARDMSSYWYKPNASREEAIAALRYQPTGMFIIRNSNSFPGAFGLAIKVNDNLTTEDSVRHFLIEPTRYGVRLRGSAVEPVFGSLSALVYAHSIEQLALPTTLAFPSGDTILPSSQAQSTTSHLLTQGAACQLLYIGITGVECITGDDAVTRGIVATVGNSSPIVVSLRLSINGLTLTDLLRQRFFRKHFPLEGISYAALDPSNKSITYKSASRKIFAVIARATGAYENSCIVLAELEEGQPANAIVAFIQRVIAWQN